MTISTLIKSLVITILPLQHKHIFVMNFCVRYRVLSRSEVLISLNVLNLEVCWILGVPVVVQLVQPRSCSTAVEVVQ